MKAKWISVLLNTEADRTLSPSPFNVQAMIYRFFMDFSFLNC